MEQFIKTMLGRSVSLVRRMAFGQSEYRSAAFLASHMKLFKRIVLRNPQHVDFDALLTRAKRVGLLVPRDGATSYWQNLVPLFPNNELVFLDEPGWGRADAYFVVGIGHNARHALEKIDAMNAPCYVVEETFLKSVAPGAMGKDAKIPLGYFKSVAYIMDARSPAFFSGIRSQLEHDIDSSYEISAAERAAARRLIERIVSNHLSKYNCQPVRIPRFSRPASRTVLVIDQAYRDFSVALSGADDSVFMQMLQCAIDENPGAQIVVRQHIDKVSRETYFSRAPLPAGVILSNDPSDAISVLMASDAVYTFSSTMGWEALMCGREVHTFGAPIYAGWGLTRDRQKFGMRRSRARSLEEWFHFIYMRGARFIDPESSRPCTIDRAIDYLVDGRERFLREFGQPV